MNRRQFTKLLAGAGLLLAGCRAGAAPSSSTPERKDSMQTTTQTYTRTTPIETVRNDPVFGDYGRLIFPVERSYYSGDTLEQLQYPAPACSGRADHLLRYLHRGRKSR